jgi:hypothetical protein
MPAPAEAAPLRHAQAKLEHQLSLEASRSASISVIAGATASAAWFTNPTFAEQQGASPKAPISPSGVPGVSLQRPASGVRRRFQQGAAASIKHAWPLFLLHHCSNL